MGVGTGSSRTPSPTAAAAKPFRKQPPTTWQYFSQPATLHLFKDAVSDKIVSLQILPEINAPSSRQAGTSSQ